MRCGFTIPDIKAVDLRNPRKLVSPFILTDASEIGQWRADLPSLERLGEELTRPVQPAGACDRLYSEPVSVRVHQKKRVRWRGLRELGQRWRQSRPVHSHSGHRRDRGSLQRVQGVGRSGGRLSRTHFNIGVSRTAASRTGAKQTWRLQGRIPTVRSWLHLRMSTARSRANENRTGNPSWPVAMIRCTSPTLAL